MAVTETTARADGRVGRRIEGYTQFWQKDVSKEASQDTENRLDNYVDVINGACCPEQWQCRVLLPSLYGGACARSGMLGGDVPANLFAQCRVCCRTRLASTKPYYMRGSRASSGPFGARTVGLRWVGPPAHLCCISKA